MIQSVTAAQAVKHCFSNRTWFQNISHIYTFYKANFLDIR